MDAEPAPDLTHIRAVLFDLFHTLVSLEVSQPPGPGVSTLLGIDRDTWWSIWVRDQDDYVLGRTDLEHTLPAKARIANPRVSEVQIRQALAARPARFHHVLTHIEPEALTGLARLRALNLKLGLVSNCGKDEVAAWPDSPLAPLFDTTVFSCAVGLAKPDPRIYRLAATRLGVEPAECLFVGDGGSDELAGARAAGMTPVLITRHLEVVAPQRIAPAAHQAAFKVRTVPDLCALLEPRRTGRCPLPAH
jgi:putative hydrolase of the HAD superfamily